MNIFMNHNYRRIFSDKVNLNTKLIFTCHSKRNTQCLKRIKIVYFSIDYCSILTNFKILLVDSDILNETKYGIIMEIGVVECKKLTGLSHLKFI